MPEPYPPVYINGAILSADDARISVFDRGFMRGDGLFETLRTYGGQCYKLDEHLARLDYGMKVLRFPSDSEELSLRDAVEKTIRISGLSSARVRVQVTRGLGSTGFTAHADTDPTVVVSIQPIIERPVHPLSVIISTIRRDERSILSGVKTINYLPGILALMEAEDAGAEDAILLNYEGFVAEGCTSNVFAVKSGTVVTPDLASGVLDGTIRRTVLDICREQGIPFEERPVMSEELDEADEIFLTSSTREIAPVAVLNGNPVGNQKYEMAFFFEAEYRKKAEG